MAGVEAVRVLSVLDEAAEGLKYGFSAEGLSTSRFQAFVTTGICVQAALILDSSSFEVFRSAGWSARAGEYKNTSVPGYSAALGPHDQVCVHLQSLTDTIIKLKAALTLKTSKDETFHPDLAKAITEVWRHMKVPHLLLQCSNPVKFPTKSWPTPQCCCRKHPLWRLS